MTQTPAATASVGIGSAVSAVAPPAPAVTAPAIRSKGDPEPSQTRANPPPEAGDASHAAALVAEARPGRTPSTATPLPAGTPAVPTASEPASAKAPASPEASAGAVDFSGIRLSPPPAPSLPTPTPAELAAVGIQPKLRVGGPGDRYEREAEAVSRAVVRGGSPPVLSSLSRSAEESGEAGSRESVVQRRATAGVVRHPSVPAVTADTIRRPGPGRPLAPSVRHAVEPAVGADLQGVTVHAGPRAAAATDALGARALTHRSHIFLGRGESATDTRLLAHEATHVVQQMAADRDVPTVQPFFSEYWQKVEDTVSDIKNSALRQVADRVRGYDLFTLLIGYDPLQNEQVERTPETLLTALFDIYPPARGVYAALKEQSLVQKVYDWVEANRPAIATSDITTLFRAAIARLNSAPGNVVAIARDVSQKLGDYYDSLKTFVSNGFTTVIEFIRTTLIEQAETYLAKSGPWTLLTKVVGWDPLRSEPVEAEPQEIVTDFLTLVGEEEYAEQMEEKGVVSEAVAWLREELNQFTAALTALQTGVSELWTTLKAKNYSAMKTQFTALLMKAAAFVKQVTEFGRTVAATVFELIKDAVLGWLETKADSIPGYRLLTVIIGRNPLTSETVARTAESLVRGFLALIPGGEAIYAKFAESGVVRVAAERITAAVETLGISAESVVTLFADLWNSVDITDLAEPAALLERLEARFGDSLSRLVSFVSIVVRELLFAALKLMNFPSDLVKSIITNAMSAIGAIKADPIGFLQNMLAALKLGFENFFDNILTHLGSGLVDWLFRGLRDAGLEPPTEFSLEAVLDFVFQVLGLTEEKLWERLGKRIGEDKVARIRGVIDTLTGIWSFVSDVRDRGMVAIWEYISGKVTDLRDTILAQAKAWIMEKVITGVATKLLSLLDPTGITAVINSFMAFFDAVQSAVEYFTDILGIVNEYVSAIAAVAAGSLAAGAAKLEQGLANAIPVAIGFLAKQVGIDDIGDQILKIVKSIRGVVDKALDWLIDKAVRVVDKVLRSAAAAVGVEPWWDLSMPVELPDGKHTLSIEGDETESELVLHSTRKPLTTWLADVRDALETQKAESGMSDEEYATNKTALDGIEAKAKAIEDIKKRSGGGFSEKQGGEISNHFKQIVKHMASLTVRGFATVIPETVLEPAGTHNIARPSSVVGKRMAASLLSVNPGSYVGSAPKPGLTDIWNQVNQDRPGTYVQGHLLNHNLHGTGADPVNLTPITRRDNTEMYNKIEKDVKKKVLDENRVVSFTVTFEYDEHDEPNLTVFERQLATRVTGKATELELSKDATREEDVNKPEKWEPVKQFVNKSFSLTLPTEPVESQSINVERVSLAKKVHPGRDINGKSLSPELAETLIGKVLRSIKGIGDARSAALMAAMPKKIETSADLAAVIGTNQQIAADILKQINESDVVHLNGETEWVDRSA